MPTIQRWPENESGPSAVQVLMVRRHLTLLGEPDHDVLETVTDTITEPGLMRDVTRAKVGLDPEWPDIPALATRHGVPLARAIAAGREGLRRLYRALLCTPGCDGRSDVLQQAAPGGGPAATLPVQEAETGPPRAVAESFSG